MLVGGNEDEVFRVKPEGLGSEVVFIVVRNGGHGSVSVNDLSGLWFKEDRSEMEIHTCRLNVSEGDGMDLQPACDDRIQDTVITQEHFRSTLPHTGVLLH